MERTAGLPWVPEKFNAAGSIIDANETKEVYDRVAIIYRDRKISYRDIQKEINRFGNSLRSLGIEIENRIAILLPDCPAWVASFFGAMKIGAVPVGLNTMMTAEDYRYFLNDSRAKVIVVSSDMARKIEAVRGNLGYLKHIIVVGNAGEHEIAYHKLVEEASPELVAADTCKDDMAYWVYTSGTTGRPKGVIHLHHDLLHTPELVAKQVYGITEGDIIFSVPRLFFHYGLVVMLSAFYNRATLILNPERLKREKVLQIITKYKVSILCGVPTFFASLLAVSDVSKKYDLSSLRLCLSAGETLPPSIFDELKNRFGVEILDGIGCTEACTWYITNKPGRIKVGSTGELTPGCEAKVVDEELRELPLGKTGELMVKVESIAAGYWNKHEMTNETFIGGWLRTGDLFYQDEEGYFWFKGRVDDVIEAGGIKVIPAEVERALVEHPAVVECAVVGAPNEHGLVKPKAFVILSPGYSPSPELIRELQQFVKAKIAPFKYPRWIDFVEELPRTATGKIKRFKLRS